MILDDSIKELGKQAPTGAALLLMCFWFLKSMQRRDKQHDEREREHDRWLAHSTAVIEANTAALTRVAELMRGCEFKTKQ